MARWEVYRRFVCEDRAIIEAPTRTEAIEALMGIMGEPDSDREYGILKTLSYGGIVYGYKPHARRITT